MSDRGDRSLPELAPMTFRDREHFVEVMVEGKRSEHGQRVGAQQARKRDRRGRAADVVRAAVPNALGTIMGGAVLALGAAAVGLLDDLGDGGVVALLAVVVVPLFLGWLWDPAPLPLDEDAARREAEATFDRLVELGVLKLADPEAPGAGPGAAPDHAQSGG